MPDLTHALLRLQPAFVLALAAVVAAALPARAETSYCQTLTDYCKAPPACSNVGGGQDFSGQTLENVNFGDRPAGFLLGANFDGTTLIGVNFGGQDLTRASFKNAVFEANKDGTRTDLSNSTLTGTCFTGATLAGADLQFAGFEETDFTCADATDAKFGPLITLTGSTGKRTLFRYARLGIATQSSSFLFPLNNMTPNPSFWKNSAFECTKLIGLAPSNFQPAGHDMSDAILKGIVLDGFAFYDSSGKTGATLDRADLTGSSLRSADLTAVSLDGATMVQTDLSGANMTQAVLYKTTATDLTQAKLNNTTLTNAVLDHATLHAAQLHSTIAGEASFQNANFQADPNNNVASIISSSFRGAHFESAALNNVTFANASDLTGATFRNTTLSGTQFPGANMTGAVFDGSTLQDVDFQGAFLNTASFASTRLTAEKTGAGVNFLCAQLGGASFSSSVLSKVNFDVSVMPPDAECCPQVGGTFFCGYDRNGGAYGHTVLPAVPPSASVTCPNGDTTQCSGTDWLIPNWTTDLCNVQSRQEVVWSKPTCGKQPKTINIPDANLKKCLQDALYNGANKPITVEAAAALRNLDCGERQIADLTGLEKKNFPALVTLDLTGNQLGGRGDFTDFSDKLEEIKLGYNAYATLTFSNTQTELNYLDASNNQLTAITVSPNTYLTYIDLSHNQLDGTQDFFATRVNNVSFLDLSFNGITSIGQASVLTEANTVYLQSNRLTTIGSVATIWDNGSGSLFYLKLDQNACFRCGTLGVDKSLYGQFGCSCDPKTCGTCD